MPNSLSKSILDPNDRLKSRAQSADYIRILLSILIEVGQDQIG